MRVGENAKRWVRFMDDIEEVLVERDKTRIPCIYRGRYNQLGILSIQQTAQKAAAREGEKDAHQG
jgi:hypothetical protein